MILRHVSRRIKRDPADSACYNVSVASHVITAPVSEEEDVAEPADLAVEADQSEQGEEA